MQVLSLIHISLYEKRLTTGDANILEVNKIKMERMNVQTEVAQNSAAHRTALPLNEENSFSVPF